MDPSIRPIPGFNEPFSSLSHLAAAAVFCALGLVLVRQVRSSAGRAVAFGVFALACVFLFTMSGVYHMLPPGAGRAVLQRLDHAAIFSLIAATFTAAHTILFRGAWRWGMIALIWALAATGITLKSIFFREIPESVGLVFYLGLGWIGLVSGIKVWLVYGWGVLRPLVSGGIAYSIGAVLEFFREPVLVPGVVGPHEVFHVAVLVGVGFHWWFVHRFAEHRV